MTIFNKKASLSWLKATLASCVLITAPALAEQGDTADLDNAAEFKELRDLNIPEHLPGLALSDLGQTDHFIEHVTKTFKGKHGTDTTEYFLVHSTDLKGRMNLNIRYKEKSLKHRKNLLKDIEKLAMTEYKLRQYASTYDKSSLQVDQQADGSATVRFNFSKFALPQDLAFFRFMQVKMTVRNGLVKSMVITNSEPFKHDLGKVNQYRQTLKLEVLNTGEYVIKHKTINAKGVCKGHDCELNMEIKPVAFFDDAAGAIIKDQQLLSEMSDPRVREENVKLENVLPFFGDTLRRKGIDLPKPYGFSMAYRSQETNFDFTSFSVFGLSPALLEAFFDPEKTHAVVNTESFTLRGDAYILPFWNVFGLVGKLNVDADVEAHFKGIDQCIGLVVGEKCLGEHIYVPSGDFNVPLHLEYDLLGAGTTLSIGYKNLFASLTGTVTKTKMKGADDWGGSIFTAQPMLGYQFQQQRAQVFIGAEYQGYDDYMTGTVRFKDIEMDYNVGIRSQRWAGLIGFNKELDKNFNITGIVNIGKDRTAATLNLGYRF
ncbi:MULTISPECIES: hypothetical protein [unclassified Agarivorans]|uniref:hypothetical protein n=1 Tax=unclassified Agarivorans TaxID=2636026 RepID=UPI0026E2443F|nr:MULTISPECIES: hypothetical protein [unclassified Agarivorans]MDO6686047.1 hypothetical protein [Agarivorans sp. 3_MG-2023]MDO6713815.1 hypothetical protein [Agarivorans sp. 2_MG-2023]